MNSKNSHKIIVVMPAYNAEETLKMTYDDLPKDTLSKVILVDDGSTDETVQIAKELGLKCSYIEGIMVTALIRKLVT